MPELYVVENHIEAVKSAARSCEDLTTRLGLAACGVTEPEELTKGWARRQQAAASLESLMHTFCEIDLGQAFPADDAARESAMRHLSRAEAAFASNDPARRAKYEQQYGAFDTVAGPFYRAFAHALGGSASEAVISETNELIDPLVKLGAQMLNEEGTRYTRIFPDLAEFLADDRTRLLTHQPHNGS